MHTQQIVDALEGSTCTLLDDSSRAHIANSLQGFERSHTGAIQLDRKAEEPPGGPTDLARARLQALALNGRRMLLDGRRLDRVTTQLRFERGGG
jgi:hypothetical protein